ncbi:hypothetical protein D3C85_1885220 [compost metagenome]
MAGPAGIARLAIGKRRLAQQALGEMQRQVPLAYALLAMQQHRVRQPGAQRGQSLPVFSLPGIKHADSVS